MIETMVLIPGTICSIKLFNYVSYTRIFVDSDLNIELLLLITFGSICNYYYSNLFSGVCNLSYMKLQVSLSCSSNRIILIIKIKIFYSKFSIVGTLFVTYSFNIFTSKSNVWLFFISSGSWLYSLIPL